MNKLIGTIGLLLFMACQSNKHEVIEQDQTLKFDYDILEKATIYEVNIRQISDEGSFAEFTKEIPRLKDFGIDILWIMPVSEIGKVKRKGNLGSPYSVKDYTSINPEFGTIDDFKNMVEVAHQNGLFVILDWVANHTAWDHSWIREHPEWYKKNDKGEIVAPVADWSDVAGLDYQSIELHTAMIKEMKWWVTQTDIDGFRCDVAGMIPALFWEEAAVQLRGIKPLFMLAEAWEPVLMHRAFDMAYAWEGHHLFNQIAQGKEPAKVWLNYMSKMDTMYQKDDILMNFTSNHDENSWNGTVEERLKDAKELFAVFSYMIPGMPLIYNGQEYDLSKRLAFFEKDSFPKIEGRFYNLYKKLNDLKQDNDALDGGKNAADYKELETENENIISFERSKNHNKLIFIGNFSENVQSVLVKLPEGEYTDVMKAVDYKYTVGENIEIAAWSFLVLEKI